MKNRNNSFAGGKRSAGGNTQKAAQNRAKTLDRKLRQYCAAAQEIDNFLARMQGAFAALDALREAAKPIKNKPLALYLSRISDVFDDFVHTGTTIDVNGFQFDIRDALELKISKLLNRRAPNANSRAGTKPPAHGASEPNSTETNTKDGRKE